tara:strand:+ start:700 stop:1362 length:663 start_codon:yes stop_codon:yes gene_type:complete
MDQFTYEQLKNELYKRDKMIEYKKNKKTFELPHDVWTEVLSYFRKPIKHLLEPLSYEKLKYYYRLTTTQQLGWFATCIPLEKRREMMYSRFLKYHHKVRQIDGELNSLIKDNHHHTDLKIGDAIFKQDNFIYIVEGINNMTYRCKMFMASPSGFDWDTELQTFRCFVAYRPYEIFADKILIPKKGYKMTSKIIEQTDVYIKLAFTNKPSEMDSGMAEAGM